MKWLLLETLVSFELQSYSDGKQLPKFSAKFASLIVKWNAFLEQNVSFTAVK